MVYTMFDFTFISLGPCGGKGKVKSGLLAATGGNLGLMQTADVLRWDHFTVYRQMAKVISMYVFSRVHATLQPTLSFGQSVGPSIRPSVHPSVRR